MYARKCLQTQAVTASVTVAPVWLLWVHGILFTGNKTLFVLFTETHFFSCLLTLYVP